MLQFWSPLRRHLGLKGVALRFLAAVALPARKPLQLNNQHKKPQLTADCGIALMNHSHTHTFHPFSTLPTPSTPPPHLQGKLKREAAADVRAVMSVCM